MTDTNPRDLIQRLAKELDVYWKNALDDRTLTHPLANEARAFLDQPEPEGLADEEILDLSEEHGVSYTTLRGFVIHPYQEVVDIKDYVLSFACALITADRARWGRPTTPTETP